MRKLTRDREADMTGGEETAVKAGLWIPKAAISSAAGNFFLSDLDIAKSVIIN